MDRIIKRKVRDLKKIKNNAEDEQKFRDETRFGIILFEFCF